MKRRAELGYGMSPQGNARICSVSEEFLPLVPLWNWMTFMQQGVKVKHQGALSLLSQQQEASEVSPSTVLPLPTYTSVARSMVLDIIGWSSSAVEGSATAAGGGSGSGDGGGAGGGVSVAPDGISGGEASVGGGVGANTGDATASVGTATAGADGHVVGVVVGAGVISAGGGGLGAGAGAGAGTGGGGEGVGGAAAGAGGGAETAAGDSLGGSGAGDGSGGAGAGEGGAAGASGAPLGKSDGAPNVASGAAAAVATAGDGGGPAGGALASTGLGSGAVAVAANPLAVQRMAAIHVCSGRVEAAVNLLAASAGNETIALALAGYSSGNATWSRAAMRLAQTFNLHPCLSGVLRLLTSTDVAQLPPIVTDSNIPLWDRLGLACIFLPDQQLLQFCTQAAQQKIAKGALDAIVLTGLGRQGGGLSLLQAYIDR
jgi:hypothetical protein